MHENNIRSDSNFFHNILHNLHKKPKGYATEITIGEDILAYSLPPHVEIVLLDSEEKIIAYRPVSSAESPFPQRKGKWKVGPPDDVVEYALNWTNSMITKKNMYNNH